MQVKKDKGALKPSGALQKVFYFDAAALKILK
jgi:hypothetical protein